MKVGDLCKVITKMTHHPCQHGNMVILMRAVDCAWEDYWETISTTTGKMRHYKVKDLVVIA